MVVKVIKQDRSTQRYLDTWFKFLRVGSAFRSFTSSLSSYAIILWIFSRFVFL